MAIVRRPTIVQEKSPWVDIFSSLQDTALALIQLNYAAIESEKTRKHDESLLYLKDQIEDVNLLEEQTFDLEAQARERGILPTEKQTKGYEVFESGSKKRLQVEKSVVEQNLNLYSQGINIGNKLDAAGNNDGMLSDDETSDYLLSLYPEGNVPEALQRGLDAWTLDPDRRAALTEQKITTALKAQQLLTEELRFEFLPQVFKDEETMRAQSIKQGTQDLEMGVENIKYRKKELNLLGHTIEQTQAQTRLMEQQYEMGTQTISMNALQLTDLANKVDSFEFEESVKMQDEVIESAGATIVDNLQAQVGIGAGILKNMRIVSGRNKVIPLFQVLTDESKKEDITDIINESSASSYIRDDLLSFVEAYHVGKGEDQLPDYSFILDEIIEIDKLDKYRSDFLSKHGAELENFAVSKGYKSKEDLISKASFAGDQAYSQARLRFEEFISERASILELNKIRKAIQWEATGIFDDYEMIEQAKAAKNQYRFLQSLLEQAHGQKLSSSLLYATPTYIPADTSAILSPFESFPLRTEEEIDDIFDQVD